jgi:hypothetical protein
MVMNVENYDAEIRTQNRWILRAEGESSGGKQLASRLARGEGI